MRSAIGFVVGAFAWGFSWILLTAVYDEPQLASVSASIGAVFSGVAVLVAVATLAIDRFSRRSEEYLNEARRSLDRFFGVLVEGKRPRKDRLVWLTAARELELFKRLSACVRSQSHRDVLHAHEEDARARLYKVLDTANGGLPESFFLNEETPEHEHLFEGIDPRSIAVIYGFTAWRHGTADPIDRVNVRAELTRDKTTLMANKGVYTYLRRYKNTYKKDLGLE